MSISATLRHSRMSIRVRLTLLLGVAVLACGLLLLATVYALMRYVPRYAASPTVPLPRPGSPSDGAVAIRPAFRATIATRDDFLDVLLQVSSVALIGLALVAFLVGWIIAGRILAPVHRIASTARTVAGDNLHERIQLDGRRDEFTELADTIDTMLDRLHTSFEAQQRFAANASHELRTPLATTRTMLQVALAHPADHELAALAPKLLATNDRSIATVESLLALSRADQGIADPHPVDLTEVAGHALDQVRDEAAASGIDLRTDLRPARVDGDQDLLHHLVINLLQNAVRHNHPGGSAHLAIAASDGTATIRVTNTGERIPAEAADRLFEAFHRHRTRTRSRGHGLGLTLVRAIAGSHHGTATAAARPDGGLAVAVDLPEAAPRTPERPPS
ncbi:HAMP domain-containing sensor histidine kinase [Saccharopolyspora sp. NFXS83]|uniref:sensor histidine kinase n=1 Tax=Saccharopolyspora sp. NFXS83 TaxID=2993560 RepID=UPI00224B3EDA|nr:HAMP domain-containing sensor histidine kinase [Saccharopolyspora sp. NFXS83]MCX2729110.1 HAMP domain-containing sensor histidine kinase [Saccharopolyspora sp. NFXS83]